MGLAGLAYGASQSLEDVVATRLKQQMLQAEIENRDRQTQIEQARLDADMQDRATNRGIQRDALKRQQDGDKAKADADATRKRGLDNMAGVLAMGVDPETASKEVAFSSLTHDADIPKGVDELLHPKPAPRDPIADHRAIKDIDNDPKYAKPTTGGTPEQVFVIRNGVPTPIRKGTAQPGDVPYDAVAARSSKPVNDTEAADTAAEAKRLASALVSHKGFGGVFGLAGSYMPTIRQDTADAEQLLKSLTGMLTMENMGKMKGVLSDSDMKVLRQASTTLDQRMGDGAAKVELDRVIQIMGKVAGAQPITPAASHDVDSEIAAIRAARRPKG